jgi:hypothetical protein
VPRKRKLQAKSTPARGGESSNALTEFLPQLRKVRDESVAEFRDDLLSARTMGELQRDFASRLNRWCGTFPALLAGHAQNLCERGLSIEEVERELENARSAITGEGRNWIALACDGELPTPDWRAPRYLAGFPARLIPTQRHIPLTMMHGRLDANETKRIVACVEIFVEEHHDVTRAAALKHARNWIEEQERLELESRGKRVAPSDPFKQRIADLMSKHSGDSHREFLIAAKGLFRSSKETAN